jgi:hypothetical protein
MRAAYTLTALDPAHTVESFCGVAIVSIAAFPAVECRVMSGNAFMKPGYTGDSP